MKVQLPSGAHLEYDSAGMGNVVVLLHAFPLCRTMWAPQVSALQGGHRVLAPDYRGFGGSAPFEQAPTLEQVADDTVALLDALKITEPVVVCGLSRGGYVALAIARKYPARLRGLVLADTRAEADDDAAKTGRDKMIAFAQSHSSAEVIDQLLPKLLCAETRANRPEVVEAVRRIASAQTQRGIVDGLRILRDRPDARDSLAAIRVPTLVIVGGDDALTPPTMAKTLADGIPKARLEEIAGAGHLSNLETPKAFNRLLVEFLNLHA